MSVFDIVPGIHDELLVETHVIQMAVVVRLYFTTFCPFYFVNIDFVARINIGNVSHLACSVLVLNLRMKLLKSVLTHRNVNGVAFREHSLTPTECQASLSGKLKIWHSLNILWV